MGFLAVPSNRSYWSTDRLYKNELFKSVISRDRCLTIMRFLYFGEESAYENDGLSKIRFLPNHLNNTVPEILIPHQNLSIDESMMVWRGRLVFYQYIKNKKYKDGVKFFKICINDGFLLRADIDSSPKFANVKSLGQTGAVVVHLMETYFNKGYHLFAENWYSYVSFTACPNKKPTSLVP